MRVACLNLKHNQEIISNAADLNALHNYKLEREKKKKPTNKTSIFNWENSMHDAIFYF